MPTINIDFEVFKALTARRATESVSENDVIRELLGLDGGVDNSAAASKPDVPANQIDGWMCKGVLFPSGTDFRAEYKGRLRTGKVVGNHLIVEGQEATSLSDAARIVTGNSVNGGLFWQCQLPGHEEWLPVDLLRVLRASGVD